MLFLSAAMPDRDSAARQPWALARGPLNLFDPA